MNINRDKITETIRVIAEAFKPIVDYLKKIWGTIKEFAAAYKPVYKQPIHPVITKAVTTYFLHSQVMDRKPRIIRARTSC